MLSESSPVDQEWPSCSSRIFHHVPFARVVVVIIIQVLLLLSTEIISEKFLTC